MSLALDDQICFKLYAAHHAVQRLYKPLLEPLELTYTQYLALLVLWEEDGLSVRQLGARLGLDSGTLTPMLKRLDGAGRIRRVRAQHDGRVVHIYLTDEGRALRARAESVPVALLDCMGPDHNIDLGALAAALTQVAHLSMEAR